MFTGPKVFELGGYFFTPATGRITARWTWEIVHDCKHAATFLFPLYHRYASFCLRIHREFPSLGLIADLLFKAAPFSELVSTFISTCACRYYSYYSFPLNDNDPESNDDTHLPLSMTYYRVKSLNFEF